MDRISNKKALIGKKFGKLTVLEFSGKKGFHYTWKCRCDCGEIRNSIFATNLKRGLSKQCIKCGHVEKGKKLSTHRLSGHKVYQCWSKIKMKCYNPSNSDFYLYGARGITMFHEWFNSFENFFSYIGVPPSNKHSIDRINNDGNYEPGNVRWATPIEQANNKRRSVRINFNGNPITIREASEISGIKAASIGHYRRKGKNLNDIIFLRKK